MREALRNGIRTLESAETPSAPLASELLLMHVLGKDRAWMYAHPEEVLSPAQLGKYSELTISPCVRNSNAISNRQSGILGTRF